MKEKLRRSRGITLVALVITIIIIIILATITMNFVFGENGLITRAQQAAEMTQIAQIQEQLEMAKGTAAIDGAGEIDPDHYFDIIEDEGIIGDKDTDVEDNGDGSYDVTTDGDYVFEVTPTPDGDLEIEYVGKNNEPRISSIKVTEQTETSVSVEVFTKNVDGGEYTYSYKKTEASSWTDAGTSSSNTFTFSGLENNTSYDIKVTIALEDGTTIEKIITVQLGTGAVDIPDNTIVFGQAVWQGDGTANMPISTTETEYTLQYQINGTDDGEWITITSGQSITGLRPGDTVYTKLTDGVNDSEIQQTTIQDTTAPTVNVSLGTSTSNSISVNVEAIDNESGMSSNSTYTYYIKESTQGDESYQTPSGASNISENTYTFTGLTQGISYDIKVEVRADIAGNMGEGTLLNQITSTIPGGGSGDIEQGAITFGIPSWSDGQASITISTSTTYQIEYKLDNPEIDEGWIEIENNGTISGLSHGDTIYARLTDGNNHGDYAVASIQDGINPIVTVTLVQDSITSNGMSVSVEAIDNESGMASDLTYTYYIKQSSQGDENYQAPAGASNISSDTYTFTGLTQGTSYDVKVEVTGDMAGNTGAGTLTGQTTTSIPGGNSSLDDGTITVSEPEWEDGKATITVETNTDFDIEYQVGDEGEWLPVGEDGKIPDLSYGDEVKIHLTDGTNDGEDIIITIGDNVPPTLNVSLGTSTSNSISVNVQATDEESGMSSNPTYTYYIKESTEPESSYQTPSGASNITSNTYTFTGLTQGISYDIKVEVRADIAGNMGEGTLLNQITTSIPGGESALEDGTLTIGEPTWSEGQASITVSTNQDYQIEYQVNGTDEGSWTTVSGGAITGLEHGDKVNIRLTDGENAGGYVTKEILDEVPPTVTVTAQGEPTSNSIAVSVSSQDNESGMSSNLTYTYYIKQSSQGDEYYQAPAGASNISSSTYTFTGLTQGTSYDVKVEVTGDVAGNTGEGTLTGQTTTSIPGGSSSLDDGTITVGEPEWEDGKATIEVSTDTDYDLEYQIGDDGEWIPVGEDGKIPDLNPEDKVNIHLTDGTNDGENITITIEDTIPPTVNVTSGGAPTSNSISVNVSASDNESGMAENSTYTYYIKQSSQDDGSYVAQATGITQNTYTFTGLTQGTSYDVKVEVTGDMAGNTGSDTLTNQTTASIPGGEDIIVDGTIEVGEPVWADGSASIDISTDSGYSIEYQINGTSEGNWTNIGNNGTVPNLHYGDTVNIRLTDGTNHGDFVTVTIGDEIAPTVDVTLGTSTSNSISVNVQAIDNESGMSNNPTYTYYIKQSSQGEGSYTVPDGASNITSNTYTFTGLTQGTSYDVKVEVRADIAGNMGEGTLLNQITSTIPGGDSIVTDGTLTIGEPTWSDGEASITVSTNQNYQIEYQVNGTDEGSWTTVSGGAITGLEHGDKVNIRLTDGENAGGYVTKEILDEVPPTVTVTAQGEPTSNSISVSVVAQDNESGMASSLTYTYYIKQSTQGDESYLAPSNATNIPSSTYTFAGLTQGTSYDVKVEVTGDVAGNTGSGTLLNQTTQSIPGGNEGVTQGAITFGTPSWSSGQASITVSTNTGYQIEYKLDNPEVDEGWTEIENNGTISGLSHGDTVYARLTDGNNHGDYAVASIQDGIDPVVDVLASGSPTSNSISVSVQASDNESGMVASPTYTYYIKQSSEEDTAYVAKASNITQNTYTFTSLAQGTSYDIKVEVTGDMAGNTGTGYLAGQTTATIPDASGPEIQEGAITFSTASWSNNKASITVSTNTSYQIEYQVGAITEGSWTGVANNGTISNLDYGNVVYARLTDGVNHGEYASASIEDGILPQAANISLSGTSTMTTGNVTATVTLADNESGVNTTGSKWVYNTNSGNIGIDEASYTNSFTENPEELTLSASTAGTYYLHVLTVDLAGNKVETISEAIIVAEPTIENVLTAGDWVRYEDGTGVERDCVVLYDSTSEYGVEIITMETVEDVTLGDDNDFTKAMNSYNSAISTLNNATSKYINTTYVDKARSVGSDPSNPTTDNPGYFTSSYSYMSSYNGKFKNQDTHYETDYNQMGTLGIRDIDEYYWLASRLVTSYSSGSYFYVRSVTTSGNLNNDYLCSVNSFGRTRSFSNANGLRPVFHLKSGIKVTGGTGEEGSPYILGT